MIKGCRSHRDQRLARQSNRLYGVLDPAEDMTQGIFERRIKNKLTTNNSKDVLSIKHLTLILSLNEKCLRSSDTKGSDIDQLRHPQAISVLRLIGKCVGYLLWNIDSLSFDYFCISLAEVSALIFSFINCSNENLVQFSSFNFM